MKKSFIVSVKLAVVFGFGLMLIGCISGPPKVLVGIFDSKYPLQSQQCMLQISGLNQNHPAFTGTIITAFDDSAVNWVGDSDKMYSIPPGEHTITFTQTVIVASSSLANGSTQYRKQTFTLTLTKNFLPGRIYWLEGAYTDNNRTRMIPYVRARGVTELAVPNDDETLIVFDRKTSSKDINVFFVSIDGAKGGEDHFYYLNFEEGFHRIILSNGEHQMAIQRQSTESSNYVPVEPVVINVNGSTLIYNLSIIDGQIVPRIMN